MPAIKAKTICIEGVDCVGKETHSIKLKDYIKNSPDSSLPFDSARLVSFPRYNLPVSRCLRKWLQRDYDRSKISYLGISSFYYDDMLDWQADKGNSLVQDNPNNCIIFDRWIFSNMIYQSMYDLSEINTRNEATIIARMSKIFEFAMDLGLEVPDHTIILYASIETVLNNLKEKKNLDANEEIEFQRKIHENLGIFIKWMRAVYKWHPKLDGKSFEVINMEDKGGNFDTIENNQSKIIASVEKAFLEGNN